MRHFVPGAHWGGDGRARLLLGSAGGARVNLSQDLGAGPATIFNRVLAVAKLPAFGLSKTRRIFLFSRFNHNTVAGGFGGSYLLTEVTSKHEKLRKSVRHVLARSTSCRSKPAHLQGRTVTPSVDGVTVDVIAGDAYQRPRPPPPPLRCSRGRASLTVTGRPAICCS